MQIFKWRWIITASMLAMTSDAIAQANNCPVVYENATRNLNVSESSFSSMNVIFDEYCSSDASKKSKSGSVAAEAVVKKVPFKFSGSAANAEEKLSNFCRNYRDTRYSTASSSSSSDQVVVEALRAFNQCEEIARRNIFISFVSPNNISSVFSFQFGNNVSYQLQGVTTDRNIACTTLHPETNNEITLTPSTYFSFSRNFSVSCVRSPEQLTSGAKYYPRTGVTFASNHGPYFISFPAEEIADGEFASRIEARLVAIEANAETIRNESKQRDVDLGAELKSETAKLNSIKNMTDKIRVKSWLFERSPGQTLTASTHIGCGSAEEELAKLCPAPNRADLQMLRPPMSGGTCGINFWMGTCLYVQ